MGTDGTVTVAADRSPLDARGLELGLAVNIAMLASRSEARTVRYHYASARFLGDAGQSSVCGNSPSSSTRTRAATSSIALGSVSKS